MPQPDPGTLIVYRHECNADQQCLHHRSPPPSLDTLLPELYTDLIQCLQSGIASSAIAAHWRSISEHAACVRCAFLRKVASRPHPHSVTHRASRDASGQEMLDEHYNFAAEGMLGRMPWPASQTLAFDVMVKGKSRYCAWWWTDVVYTFSQALQPRDECRSTALPGCFFSCWLVQNAVTHVRTASVPQRCRYQHRPFWLLCNLRTTSDRRRN